MIQKVENFDRSSQATYTRNSSFKRTVTNLDSVKEEVEVETVKDCQRLKNYNSDDEVDLRLEVDQLRQEVQNSNAQIKALQQQVYQLSVNQSNAS